MEPGKRVSERVSEREREHTIGEKYQLVKNEKKKTLFK